MQYSLLFLSSAFLPVSVMPKWVQVVATINPITYGVDAVRGLMLGRDVLTVVDVTAFSGLWNSVVPAVVVLGALDLVLGGIAVTCCTVRRARESSEGGENPSANTGDSSHMEEPKDSSDDGRKRSVH